MTQEELTDLPYRLHCCDIVLAEIKNDLAAFKELKAIRSLLKADLEEIKTKGPSDKIFLVHPYW